LCISKDVNDVDNIGKDFLGGRKGCQLFICDKYGWRWKVFCLLIIYRLYDFRQKVIQEVAQEHTPVPVPVPTQSHSLYQPLPFPLPLPLSKYPNGKIINNLRVFMSLLFSERTFASREAPKIV